MIKRIVLYGVVSGVGVVWITGYFVEKANKAITGAVNSAWQKTP